MKQNGITPMLWITLWLALFLGASACAGKTTPPGANMIFGTLTTPEGFGGSYTLLQWKEGLSIIIIDDSQGTRESSSSGSTDDPIWREHGSISTANAQSVPWQVETTDGKIAQFSINEQSYDLTRGTLFLIKMNNGSPQVIQHQSDGTEACSDDESCQKMLKQESTVRQFIQETVEQSGQSSPVEMEPGPTASSPVAADDVLVPAGWVTYSSQQCEYTIHYPAEMQVRAQTPYSNLLMFSLPDSDAGAQNFVYMSVITTDIKSWVEQGVYDHEVYNYDPAATEILLKMQVGESRSVHPSADLASGFTFQRLPDKMISGHAAKTYENLLPWEFPEGTKEIRYYVSMDGCTYIVGGYMDTAELDQPGTITESLFHQIIGTVQWLP